MQPLRRFSARLLVTSLAVAAGATVLTQPAGATTNSYKVTPLVTDTAGGPVIDADLVNPWGMAQGPSTPVWVANNHTDTSTLYANGAKVALTVAIPGGAPTGQVFNASMGFLVKTATGMAPAKFIFDSEAGIVTGWAEGTTAVKVRTIKTAVYKGLAIATSRGATRLYAADFHNGRVDVFDSKWKRVTFPGGFKDSRLPSGYAPFGIQALHGHIYVSYAKQGPGAADDSSGPGRGFIDVFSPTGTLLKRLISRGHLNSPWAMVTAPAHWGSFGGDLLVGNFGNGQINAYDGTTGAFKGTLKDSLGYAISLPGLWGLLFGNGTSAATNALMYTAGPSHETHGVFGTITAG